MHHEILLAGIENGGYWPWHSRRFWPSWLRILGNSGCPRNNLICIWATIMKFAPIICILGFSAGIKNGGHWHWLSKLFSHFNSEFQASAFNGCYTSQRARVLCCCPEQAVGQTVELLVIWDTMTLVWSYFNPVDMVIHIDEWLSRTSFTEIMAC